VIAMYRMGFWWVLYPFPCDVLAVYLPGTPALAPSVPGGIIPGPGKPKNLDSFLFPGLAHVSALQKEGLHIWDGYNRMAAISFIFLLLALADAVC